MVRSVAKLTDDLVAEILSRLPTKSFFRFQCVSKSWYALSSDPCYQNKFPRAASGLFFNIPDLGAAPIHGARRGIRYISLSNNDDDLAIDTGLSFFPTIWSMEVVSSCNGLLLCRSLVPQIIDLIPCGVKAQSLCVCNPATREWFVVPKASDTFSHGCLALGFDPRVSRHYHVLWFNFYEIPRFMIFSSKTNEWVVSEVFEGSYHQPQDTFFQGIFYFTNGLNQVLGVDLEGKICRRIELPESDGIECLGHSGGYLHYMVQSKDEIKVWMLKDYSHVEWVLKSCINIGAMLQNYGTSETQDVHDISGAQDIDILEFHPDVDVVFLQIEEKIFSYHLNCGRLEEVGELHYVYGRECFAYSPRLSKGFGDEVA